jgi:hypothetical protein
MVLLLGHPINLAILTQDVVELCCELGCERKVQISLLYKLVGQDRFIDLKV